MPSELRPSSEAARLDLLAQRRWHTQNDLLVAWFVFHASTLHSGAIYLNAPKF
jgi:hypothetical protein